MKQVKCDYCHKIKPITDTRKTIKNNTICDECYIATMDKKDLRELRHDVITNRVLYDRAVECLDNDLKNQMAKRNLSLDRDIDLDKIVDLEIELSEKYETERYYKQWSSAADWFIIHGLKYMIEHRAKKNQVKILTELLNSLETDQSKLIIYRERMLEILLSWDELQEPNIKPLA